MAFPSIGCTLARLHPNLRHVIPANAGIQETTSLAESQPFGSDDGPRLAPLHRGPWIPAFAGMTNWAQLTVTVRRSHARRCVRTGGSLRSCCSERARSE